MTGFHNHKMINTGLENFIQSPPDSVKGKRLGLLANPASLTRGFVHSSVMIHQRFPGQLTALFSPQHGFYAEKQDNMIESSHGVHPELQIPIFSLYSHCRIPAPEMFDLFDTLVIDLQDVGTRVYTFIYTISYCLEMASVMKKTVVILDRPNPLGGLEIEGNILETEYSSFVGRYPVPMRHGLTVGEIASFFNVTFNINCHLEIIPMSRWKRNMYFSDTGLTWVAPSPNLPTPHSAYVYPGQVVFEGTNISEGRGTALPFEQFGASFIDFSSLDKNLLNKIRGVFLREVCFEPTSGKFAGIPCRGFFIHIIDLQQYKPYQTSLILLQEIIRKFGNDFEFKKPPYEYEYDRMPIDLILGSKSVRKQIVGMENISDMVKSWQAGIEGYKKKISGFLIYD